MMRRERAGVAMSETAVLRTENLRKAYGDKVVLRDIDLVVEPHDVICLIGSSGSGKSTLLRCLDLLEDIDDGAIFFEGQDISDPRVDARAVRRRMGVVFQAYNLFPHLSVLDNVTLAPRKVHGARPGDRGGQGDGAAHQLRARRQGPRAPRPAVRRPAAAGRDGARDGHRPGAAAARRGDRGARPRADRRGAGDHAAAGGGGHDDGAGDARDGLRPRRGDQGLLPARRRDPRAGAARGDLRDPREERTRQFLRRVLEP